MNNGNSKLNGRAAGVYSYRRIQTLTEQLLSEALSLLDAPTQIELPLTQPPADSHGR